MKKVFLLVFALCTALIGAEETPIFTGLKGSYAIYEDIRYENPVYIGVCYIGNDSIFMRSYEPVTGNDVVLRGKFNNIDGILDYDPTMYLVRGALDSSDAAKRLLPVILNWANTWFNLKGDIGTDTKYNGDSGYKFSFWIPVFQLSSIGIDDGLKLISSGIAQNEADPAFFDFKGLPKAGYAPSYTIEKKDPINVEVEGISVPLDANWKESGDNSYEMSQFSDKDAVFSIETSRPMDSGINSTALLVTLQMLPKDNEILLANGSKVFITDGIFNLVKRTYDENTKRVSIHQMQFLPRGNGYISTAELTVLETLYLKNKSYFNSILY